MPLRNIVVAALFVATTSTTALTVPSPAEARVKLSEYQVSSVRSRGSHCAYIRAFKIIRFKPTFNSTIQRRACFPTRGECQNWLYWAQTYWERVKLRKRCT